MLYRSGQWGDWQPVKGFWWLFGWRSWRAQMYCGGLIIQYQYSKERKH